MKTYRHSLSQVGIGPSSFVSQLNSRNLFFFSLSSPNGTVIMRTPAGRIGPPLPASGRVLLRKDAMETEVAEGEATVAQNLSNAWSGIMMLKLPRVFSSWPLETAVRPEFFPWSSNVCCSQRVNSMTCSHKLVEVVGYYLQLLIASYSGSRISTCWVWSNK